MSKKGTTQRVTGEWAKHLRRHGKREAAKCERHSWQPSFQEAVAQLRSLDIAVHLSNLMLLKA